MKQTSIEWLEMEIVKLETMFAIPHKIYELCEQAKQMHKQEIIDAWDGGDYAYFYSKETGRDFEDGEEYYNETFKKD